MRVFQTNTDGLLMGVTLADPDPMQPGEWLIPAGCVVDAPPDAPTGYATIYRDGAWITVAPPEPPEVVPPTLDSIRATASIERAAFCNALADFGIITDAEAIDAARGIWPASMAGFLTLLDTRQQRDAQIEWASCATVQRMHWVILSMISVGIVTEAQADALCGITP